MIYVTNCIFNVKIIDLLKQTFFCPFEQKIHGCKRVRFSVVFHLKMYKKVLICDQLKQIIFYLSLSNIKVQPILNLYCIFGVTFFLCYSKPSITMDIVVDNGNVQKSSRTPSWSYSNDPRVIFPFTHTKISFSLLKIEY